MNERILYHSSNADSLTIVAITRSYEGVENIGEPSVIKSISNCLIHHKCRQYGWAGIMTQGLVQDYLEQERKKRKEIEIKKKHYRLFASPLIVSTVPTFT